MKCEGFLLLPVWWIHMQYFPQTPDENVVPVLRGSFLWVLKWKWPLCLDITLEVGMMWDFEQKLRAEKSEEIGDHCESSGVHRSDKYYIHAVY